jgi:hypothetical protein
MADISADLQQKLDQLQAAYKAAVDKWVAAIREEEGLASGNHNVAELDQWEAAHFASTSCTRKPITGSDSTRTRCVANSSASDLPPLLARLIERRF